MRPRRLVSLVGARRWSRSVSVVRMMRVLGFSASWSIEAVKSIVGTWEVEANVHFYLPLLQVIIRLIITNVVVRGSSWSAIDVDWSKGVWIKIWVSEIRISAYCFETIGFDAEKNFAARCLASLDFGSQG